jgi:hypothetical protein
MKNLQMVKFYSAFAILGLVSAQLAYGQACPTPYAGTVDSAQTVNGNTCGHNTSYAIINGMCGNSTSLNGGGADIYQFNVGATNNFTVTVSSSAFTPQIFFLSGTCSTSNSCAQNLTDAGPDSGSVSFTYNPAAAGTYYLMVADTNGNDAAGCGAYNLQVAGTLPVKLQKFSVK